ncbi:MAG: Fe-Mn family superoxide dismutase [Simkaniaceae bacterium]
MRCILRIMPMFFLIICMQILAEEKKSSPNMLTYNYQAKDFSYLLGKMEGFNDQLLNMHFKLYEGYVKNTNKLLKTLKKMTLMKKDNTIAFGALKRRMGWEMDGMLLHELYFENLGGNGKVAAGSPLYKKIEEDFGSYELWKRDYKSTGLIRGIGWVILYQDPKDGRLHNVWINEHDLGHIAGGTPVLVMDVWEHAYMTQYGLDRAGYIDAFFKNIHWETVSKRLKISNEKISDSSKHY